MLNPGGLVTLPPLAPQLSLFGLPSQHVPTIELKFLPASPLLIMLAGRLFLLSP
jgi:hypothetical protein